MTSPEGATPDLDGFRAAAADPGRRVIAVHRRLRLDDQTPVSLYAQLCGDREHTFLLESAESGVWSRWSIIGVNAVGVLSGKDGSSSWSGRELAGIELDGPPLQQLATLLHTLHTPAVPELPPFTSGMVGYLGYDCVRYLESLPDTNADDLGIPDLVMMLAGDVAVMDHQKGELWLIANAINHDGSDQRVDQAYVDAVARIDAMVARLAEPRPSLASYLAAEVATTGDGPNTTDLVRQRTDQEYREVVTAAVEEIKAGEAFQIVPSQRFSLPNQADALEVYRELRASNPSPYLYLLRLPGFDIVGSSPEALVTVKDGVAITNPIAGTRPRGATPAEDLRLEQELLADPKEIAEHIMLVDLGRNDLGRVCQPGSVEVTSFKQVGRYSHVMHLEATVQGAVADGHSGLDVMLACFPAGTLSGAPKVRAMELIDKFESSRRGLYGGVVGYFDFAGNADAAIAIRTALLKDGLAHVQAGAGVVADSVPATENAETLHKAAAVLGAVRRAQGASSRRVQSPPREQADS